MHSPPLRKEKAIMKAHKLLLEGTKIPDCCLFNPTVEGALIDQKVQKLLGLKNSLDPLLNSTH